MTQGKKFKKAVRERMAETGESYTAARHALMRETVERQRDRGDPLGLVDDPEAWRAAGGDEAERVAVQADVKRYERVKELCRQIHERHMFSSRHATDDPAYHELVALGTAGIPQILRHVDEYKQGRAEGMAIWEPLLALYKITGVEPEPAHGVVVEDGWVKSHLPTLVDTWLEWGRKEGHEWRR